MGDRCSKNVLRFIGGAAAAGDPFGNLLAAQLLDSLRPVVLPWGDRLRTPAAKIHALPGFTGDFVVGAQPAGANFDPHRRINWNRVSAIVTAHDHRLHRGPLPTGRD